MAAEVAHEADRLGQADTGNTMWRLVRRCRVRALMLRAQARALTTHKL
jgi:hypothetical protein